MSFTANARYRGAHKYNIGNAYKCDREGYKDNKAKGKLRYNSIHSKTRQYNVYRKVGEKESKYLNNEIGI